MTVANPRRQSESAAGPSFSRHHEGVVHVAAPLAAVFDRLDDQERLAEHMRKPSAMMGGGRMTYQFDEGRGREVGSRIRMGGSAFGITLFVEEVITRREPPTRKIWRTTDRPRLIVIGGYEMGFECEAQNVGTRLAVWIDYDLPTSVGGKLLGVLLAPLYARWCVTRMLGDAAKPY